MLTALHDLTGQAPASLNAWSIVALGAGAFIAHAYHTVVNAGGLKRLWSNFWNGPGDSKNSEARSQKSETVQSP